MSAAPSTPEECLPAHLQGRLLSAQSGHEGSQCRMQMHEMRCLLGRQPLLLLLLLQQLLLQQMNAWMERALLARPSQSVQGWNHCRCHAAAKRGSTIRVKPPLRRQAQTPRQPCWHRRRAASAARGVTGLKLLLTPTMRRMRADRHFHVLELQ